MAVSQQWYIQWAPPSALIADITQNFNSVNNLKHSENRYVPNNVFNPLNYNVNNNYGYSNFGGGRQRLENKLRNGTAANKLNSVKSTPSSTAGLTVWLTAMALNNLVSGQSMPVDTDTAPFSTLYKWRQIDFEFPSARHRSYAYSSGKFISSNVLPLGLEVWGSRVWLTFPNWRRGVPATLATVSRAGGLASPQLRPYPNWDFHTAFGDQRNCSGLTSVFRIKVDPCGRLWVLDSGQIDIQNSPKQVCPPSLVVFDLHTDRLIAKYIIPKKYVLQDSLYSNIVVDTQEIDCSDLHVYIADTWRFGLLVFREYDEKFWRFTNPLFYPDPMASNYTLHGVNFHWADGILGLALTPVNDYEDRKLIFHSMSSYTEFAVSTSILQDPSRVSNSYNDFYVIGERGVFGQSSVSAIDRQGIMFFGLVLQDSVGCWNTHKPYTRGNLGVVARNPETLVFPNDMRIDQEREQSVWIISNRLPMYQAGPLDENDYNFRLMYADTTEAIRGTVCEKTQTKSRLYSFRSEMMP